MLSLTLSILLAFARALVGDSDGVLLGAVASGQRTALRTLYDRYSRRVLAAAVKVLGATSDAEDVTQEVFVEVWRHASTFDAGRGSASGWIMSIARHRAVDRARTRKPTGALTDAAEPTAEDESPLEWAEAAQARARVGIAMAALSPAQRRVIELAYFEGLSPSEIATRTGDPLGTVKSRVHSAMAALSTTLGADAAVAAEHTS